MNKNEARKIAALIKAKYAHLDVPDDQWFLNDWRHEQLRPGSWSLASQGRIGYDWPWYCVDDVQLAEKIIDTVGWWVELEANTGYILNIYDRRERGDRG